MTAPVFILSLPRSGSTLLQRILATHSEIETTPEPWIMLPVVFGMRSRGTYAIYDAKVTFEAISGFAGELSEGKHALLSAAHDYGMSIYTRAAQGKKYFLDKTPRYHLIAGELLEIFNEGKFIVLLRNPLAVLASIIETWRHTHIFRVDLYAGLACLVEVLNSGVGSTHVVNYEDLVMDPEEHLQSICDYLSIDYEPKMLDDFASIEIPAGDFGNPETRTESGTSKYQTVSQEPLAKWSGVLSRNPLRRLMAMRYLKWIGRNRLESMGYSMTDLSSELRKAHLGFSDLGGDAVSIVRGVVSASLETQIIRDKLSRLNDLTNIYAHR